MIFLYLIALIPSIVGIILWVCNKEVIWLEWLGSTAIAFLCSAIIHLIVITGMGQDVETHSGQISRAVHYPEWVEEYTEVHFTHDSKGNVTGSYTDTHHRTHHEEWKSETTIGDEHDISKNFFNEIRENFRNLTTEKPHKSGFDSGDPNIYVAYNKTSYVYPITGIRHWQNKIKISPSVFSFAKVPKGTPVYEYPSNEDWLKSDRLFMVPIDLLEFDRMNSRLGSHKKVNVIIINFGRKDSSIAKWQQAKWLNGKKNDIVICYGGVTQLKADWVFCFGWTEKELVKRNLETIFLDNKINNDIMPIIEKEIRENYIIKDWSKFDYITIYPPTWSYWVLITLMIITQVAFWYWATGNEFEKIDGNNE